MIKPMNYAAADLLAFADQLLQTAGLPPDKAQAVAEVLLEGDLLGHTTHGLALLAPYLAELEAAGMTPAAPSCSKAPWPRTPPS